MKNENIVTKKKYFLTDSRFLSDPKESIFFAIKGERHNGHDFIENLYQAGIREFVLEAQETETIQSFVSNHPDAKCWVVQNSIWALQKLAGEHRAAFKYPVIAITGSNGKTIVKEWLSFLLEDFFEVVKSPRSYNSQIGVALSVLEMSSKHNLGIFEAGISKEGEMQRLEKIIQPEIGIFTNIGSAHDEGFKSQKQKISEKLKLFKNAKILIYCKDYPELHDEINLVLKPVNPNLELITWSHENCTRNGNSTLVQIEFNNFIYDLTLPFIDKASIENAIHCAYAGMILCSKRNISEIDFLDKFSFLKPIAMRLELKQGANNNYIIDDTYNNDLGGLKMAFNFMNQHHTKRDKVLILSDMLQTGLPQNDLYAAIADLIKSQNIAKFIGVGPQMGKFRTEFEKNVNLICNFYDNTLDFISNFERNQLNNSLILVKGARLFEFEKIVNRLVMKVHGTVLEINLNALTHNLNYYKSKISKNTKMMVMVKAFAYGSGSAEVASWLQYHRIDYLAVAYADEGVVLRQDGIKTPILVLNSDQNTFQSLFDYNLEPEIFSLKILNDYVHFKASLYPEIETKIHLKLDTGMHRLGFVADDLNEILRVLKQNPKIKIASIFSHLVGADEEMHSAFSKSQIENFTSFSDEILKNLNYCPLRHISNTAGILRFPEANFDMVRLGIGIYGVDPTGQNRNALQVVSTLKTTISQIKILKSGDTVGYSRNGKIDKETRIATLAIGYADGYNRRFGGGQGKVWVNGVACATVGNICMDMTMIDVSDVSCKEGDQVVIFGENPSIYDLASSIQTIPYEILTNVSERVKRVFYHE